MNDVLAAMSIRAILPPARFADNSETGARRPSRVRGRSAANE